MTAQRRGGLVYQVEPGSLAEYLGITPGDRIVSVSGHILRDEIDFRFYSAAEHITLDVQKQDGTRQRFEIEKDPDDLMGVSFVNPVFDSIRTCNNSCCFCFISQLPPGMRRPLYVRDDDYRLSFLFGNFISLTNLTEDDWKRIEEQRLSPLRVSLHTSNPCLRAQIMGCPEAAYAMDYLRRFGQLGIGIHIQIVLMKGINDGDRLVETLRDLEGLGETILSVGVVPAVYTKYRKVLPSPLGDPAWARKTLEIIENYAEKVYKERGIHWVYGADEFYMVSGKPFPDYDYYDDFPQFENGIGIVADFRETLKTALSRARASRSRLAVGPEEQNSPSCRPGRAPGAGSGRGKILVVTGYMAYPEVVSAVEALGLGHRISVIKVRNNFFGDTVTCAGLLTGGDILSAIMEFRGTGERFESVLIPSYSVFEGRFLDDMTVSGLSEATGVPVEVVAPSPMSFLDAALGLKEGRHMGYVVAIVGRPNVGKSELFNRMVGARASIVHSQRGVTRDRLYASSTWQGEEFTLLDTGGFDLTSSSELAQAIRVQIEQAIEESDLLIFVVDARAGLMPEDEEIADILRKAGRPVLVAANKCDSPKHKHRAAEFYALGFAEVFPVSAAHERGVGDLLDRVIELKREAGLSPEEDDVEVETGQLDALDVGAQDQAGMEGLEDQEGQEGQEDEEIKTIRVAIVGKPNVGKSSLVNQLIGRPRMTVSSIPGTTVDAVDITLTYEGIEFVLVDTAGMRRPARIDEKLESLAVGKALQAVKRCDIAILVLDGRELPSAQERRIAGYIRRNLKGSILVVNKVDLGLFDGMSREAFARTAKVRCHPVWYSNVLFTSCVTGEGIDLILPEVVRTYREYSKRVGTSLLKKVVDRIIDFSPPPRDARVFYCTQVGTRPPQIAFSVRDPEKMPDSYVRYLEAEIRRRFGFEGVPIVMEFRPFRRKRGT
ncbi:MAG TPA: ribosome biogenesis GTPase Der [Bacillota bacterium]|nr:ribosome biogenesis GTPase Der [Bacillota bacterium]